MAPLQDAEVENMTKFVDFCPRMTHSSNPGETWPSKHRLWVCSCMPNSALIGEGGMSPGALKLENLVIFCLLPT